MALSVAETESGRAMMINLAMAQADAGEVFRVSERRFFSLMLERWPHYAHYRVRHGRGTPHHCPPDTFGFIGSYGPSDCDWIVPGTL